MLSGTVDGEVQIAQHTFLVQDGELMCFIPSAEGGSEPITFETAERLIFLLKLICMNARANREQ